MSGVAVVTWLLAEAAPGWPAGDAVQGSGIMGGVIPLGTPVPALGVKTVGNNERTTVSMREPRRLQTERVQVTVHAATYAQQKSLVRLAALACRNRNGLVNGVDLDSILPGGEGPDGYLADPVIYQQTLDLIVKWRS